MRQTIAGTLTVLCLALPGCGGSGTGSGPASEDAPFKSIDPAAVVLWDRQTQEFSDLIKNIADTFNKDREGLPVRVEYMGDYSDIYRKVTLSIQAGELPSMAVGYESMTAEYVRLGAVRPLGEFIRDPELGFSEEEIADFFPGVVDTNRYGQFGGEYYSFPFCKSVLTLFFNKRVLKKAGFDGPPQTWDDFLEQCRAVRAKTGNYGYALNADCSTLNGMIFSRGGDIVSGNQSLYDSPQSIAAFEFLETLAKEKLAYQITPGTYDDREAFAQDKAAFFFRSSVHRPFTQKLMQGDQDAWGLAMIPQADPANPSTVLYGPNVMVFKTGNEQERVAWEFIRHFTSPEISSNWALITGYIPMHKSSAADPRVQAYWKEWEYNRVPFDSLAVARAEPNLVGWQEVRSLVERAWSDVMSEVKTGREAALELKQQADAVLARFQSAR
ncbi:MAG: ABC transporter substrate-binding protein [Candidatus Hydrogenedentota bacterium]